MTDRFHRAGLKGIQLRPVLESDLEVLFEYQREPLANEMAAFPARDRNAFLAHWKKITGDESVVAMVVVVEGRVAGHVGCWTQEGQRLVGYWIGMAYWGQGVATQMLSQFLKLVSDRPLYARVAKHNTASIRVLEKCGFLNCTKETVARSEPADGVEEVVFVLETSAPHP